MWRERWTVATVLLSAILIGLAVDAAVFAVFGTAHAGSVGRQVESFIGVLPILAGFAWLQDHLVKPEIERRTRPSGGSE